VLFSSFVYSSGGPRNHDDRADLARKFRVFLKFIRHRSVGRSRPFQDRDISKPVQIIEQFQTRNSSRPFQPTNE
jgi:hypothetical protein